MKKIIKPLLITGLALITGAILFIAKGAINLHNAIIPPSAPRNDFAFFYGNLIINLLIAGFAVLGSGMILHGFYALKERSTKLSILVGVASILFGIAFIFLASAFVPDGQMKCVLSGNHWCT